MILVNKRPIFPMDNAVDTSCFAELDMEICLGLAKAKETFLTNGSDYTRGDATPDLYDHRFKDVTIAASELRADERAVFETLTYAEKQRYLKYAKGAYHPWSVCYTFLTSDSWNDKMNSAGKVLKQEARELFPKTIDWCYRLPQFREIGRIAIFGVDPRQHVTCHRDLEPSKWPTNNELLMVCPRGDKKFFVYDPLLKEKIFPETRCYIFSDLNFHGVEPSPRFTYSLRIDGKYTDEFAREISWLRPESEERRPQKGER